MQLSVIILNCTYLATLLPCNRAEYRALYRILVAVSWGAGHNVSNIAWAPAANNARHSLETPSPAVVTSSDSSVDEPWRAALDGAQDITTWTEMNLIRLLLFNYLQSGLLKVHKIWKNHQDLYWNVAYQSSCDFKVHDLWRCQHEFRCRRQLFIAGWHFGICKKVRKVFMVTVPESVQELQNVDVTYFLPHFLLKCQ